MGEQLFEAFSGAADEADWTYLPYGPFESVDDFMSWLFHVEGQTDPMFFTVVDNRDDTCAGLASYLRIDPVRGVRRGRPYSFLTRHPGHTRHHRSDVPHDGEHLRCWVSQIRMEM